MAACWVPEQARSLAFGDKGWITPFFLQTAGLGGLEEFCNILFTFIPASLKWELSSPREA